MLEVHQLDPIQETEEQHNSEAGTMMRASGTGNAGKNSKIGNAENFAESRTIADDSNNELQVDDKASLLNYGKKFFKITKIIQFFDSTKFKTAFYELYHLFLATFKLVKRK